MKTLLAAPLAALALVLGGCGDQPGTAVDDPPASGAGLVLPRGREGLPPPIVARAAGAQQEAWQGSYCWGNGCADMISPPWEDLPVLGSGPTVLAGFVEPRVAWSAGLEGHTRRCAGYPVMLTPNGGGTYTLTPAGPAGEYQLDVFLQPDGGDTSGFFRWTTPGAAAPTSWAHVHQNGPNEGGGGAVRVVLDGAAVDGDVTGSVTVSGADDSKRFTLTASDPGCPGDHYVTLAPEESVDEAVDGLGAGPFTYDVDVVIDGAHHHATAMSTKGAEDTPLTFDPALPE